MPSRKKTGQGNPLETSENNTYIILKHNNDILCCGKAVDGKILNYVPKERRIQVS